MIFSCNQKKELKFDGVLDLNYNNYDTLSIIKKFHYTRVISDMPTFIKKDKDTTSIVTFENNTNTILNIDWSIKLDSINVEVARSIMRKERLTLISPFQFYNKEDKSEGFSFITVRDFDNNIFFVKCSKEKISKSETENILYISYYKPLVGLELDKRIKMYKNWDDEQKEYQRLNSPDAASMSE